MLEWYDFYLYIYWSPILSKRFFGAESSSANLLFIMAFYVIGFIFRPIGGVFFGRLGDTIGRKRTFISSLIVMAGSTFLMGFIPTYETVGIFAPILLAFLRITQTFPSGGELPGAFCYLYEAGTANKKFMTSFAGFSNQLGGLLAAVECYFLTKHYPLEVFPDTGWRISFIVGGLIGLCLIFLRYRLHETSAFHDISVHHKIVRYPLWQVFQENCGKIIRGGAFGAMQTLCYHFIAVIFPIYFFQINELSNEQRLITSMTLLAIITLPLPFYGLLAEKYSVSRLAIISSLCVLVLLFPLHIAIGMTYNWLIMPVIVLLALCVSCVTAIWPYFVTNLFPTNIRYTCVGLSFNIADGVFGGIGSLFTYYLINIKHDLSIFIIIAFISCAVSISSCIKLRIM